MKILIVEDDIEHAKDIVSHVKRSFGEKIEVLGPFAHYKEVIRQIKTETFDMAILDIQLQEDSYAGIHIGENIELSQKVPILYITGISDNKIIEQTRTIANCDFISKPYDEEAITRALQRTLARVNGFAAENATDRISHKPGNRDQYWIKEGNSTYIGIPLEDIVYVEAKDKVCEFNLVNGDIIVKRATLEKQIFNQTLSAYDNFHKLGRSYIVNLKHISHIQGKRILYPQFNKLQSIRIPDDQIKSLFEKIGLNR